MKTASDAAVEVSPPDRLPQGPAVRSMWPMALASLAVVAILITLAWQTRPRVPAYTWAALTGPAGPVNLDSLVALDDGPALLSGVTATGVTLWWWDRGPGWQDQTLPGAPSQLSVAGDRLIAYRVREGQVLTRDEEGSWAPGHVFPLPAETRARQASGRPGIMGTSDWLIQMSLFGDVWRSDDSDSFTEVISDPTWGHGVEQPFTSACTPPARSSPDVPPVVATDEGLIALVSANGDEPFGIWPVCEPVTWTSEDGSQWTRSGPALTDGSYVYDVAWRDGVYVAVGGRGLDESEVWTSGDGLKWVEMTVFPNQSADLFRVEAGGAGWVVLGQDASSSTPVGWTSRDGSCWEPIPAVSRGSEAAVTEHSIFLIDRTTYPRMWSATATGSEGVCA